MSWLGSPAQFGRKMGKVAWNFEKKAIRELVDEAAEIGRDAAAERTPEDTGELLRSLKITRSIPSNRAYAQFGWTAEHAPIIIPGRRKSKSKKKGRFFGSLQKGRGNVAYRVRRVVDKRLGHLADDTVRKSL